MALKSKLRHETTSIWLSSGTAVAEGCQSMAPGYYLAPAHALCRDGLLLLCSAVHNIGLSLALISLHLRALCLHIPLEFLYGKSALCAALTQIFLGLWLNTVVFQDVVQWKKRILIFTGINQHCPEPHFSDLFIQFYLQDSQKHHKRFL